ncbi:uncharacterized protein LOC105159685 [Sesamum indicum]|uniref:Uncharacterized protein LOC105159685 n=1 Tax=Sesamum indicum TaxID=4182 RepID=A0A8M8UQW7_SESIN|nr:uncharacterized protein LOC105159685 [Sesamum indicum]XP_020548829.1 uncharacterized protein LOC105159685 [Sesamum indicum]
MVFLLEFAAAFALLKWRNAHSDSALAPAENSSSLSTTPLHFSQLYYKKWIRLTDFPLCIPLVVDNLTGLGRVLISMSTFSIVPRKLETDSATISCGKSTIWLQSQLTKGGTFERLFMISYLDEEILIIRDTAGVPEVLRRLDPGPSQTV